MNYGEIKQNIISLGFAEQADYDEYEELGYTYNAINRAISFLGNSFPYLEKYEFELDDTDEGILYIDMTDRDGFLELAETPVMFEANGQEIYRKFGDYQVEMGHIIVMNASDYVGSFRIYYSKQCTQVDANTPDTFVPELPLKVHHLIPLLASYYLWLDDDVAKATTYYNMYEQESAVVMAKESQPRMRVRTDWGSGSNDGMNRAFPLTTNTSDDWGY
jgi:hypothetical protein